MSYHELGIVMQTILLPRKRKPYPTLFHRDFQNNFK